MKSTASILAALPGLSQDQLQELRARATALLGTSTKVTDDERFVFDCMVGVLEEEGAPEMPFAVFTKTRGYPKFKEGVVIITRFITKQFNPRDKRERLKVLMILLRMLVEKLKAAHAPATHFTLSQQLVNVHAAVDSEFPGYRESGLLRWVIEKFQIAA